MSGYVTTLGRWSPAGAGLGLDFTCVVYARSCQRLGLTHWTASCSCSQLRESKIPHRTLVSPPVSLWLKALGNLGG